MWSGPMWLRIKTSEWLTAVNTVTNGWVLYKVGLEEPCPAELVVLLKPKLFLISLNPLKPKLVQTIFKKSARTSKRTLYVTITTINLLSLFQEVIPV
jgi:hypothetical protein